MTKIDLGLKTGSKLLLIIQQQVLPTEHSRKNRPKATGRCINILMATGKML